MGVKGYEFYIRGYMKEQRLVRGPLCIAFASLRHYEEKNKHCLEKSVNHELWKNCETCSEKN